jgi:hypothetical protein
MRTLQHEQHAGDGPAVHFSLACSRLTMAAGQRDGGLAASAAFRKSYDYGALENPDEPRASARAVPRRTTSRDTVDNPARS